MVDFIEYHMCDNGFLWASGTCGGKLDHNEIIDKCKSDGYRILTMPVVEKDEEQGFFRFSLRVCR